MSNAKEAAERLRKLSDWGGDLECTELYECKHAAELSQIADECALVEAYLSEHAADDDEVIDNKWWMSQARLDGVIELPLGGVLIFIWGRILLDSRCIIKDATRGQLRRLIAALQPTSEANRE